MIEDEPIPVANNDNEENVNFSREETAIKGAPHAITGVNNKKMQMNLMAQVQEWRNEAVSQTVEI